jgi:Domain of unknown function (DUF1707)
MDVMSNESRGVAGSDNGKGDTTRVGTAERDDAIELLGEHWRAGRLDPAEHELRVTRARAAVTRGDLDVLFADLPPARPVQNSTGAGGAAEAVAAGEGAVARPEAAGFLKGKRDTLMALTPFAALFLFFMTDAWVWFLLVPVMGILLYGPDGKKNPRQQGS